MHECNYCYIHDQLADIVMDYAASQAAAADGALQAIACFSPEEARASMAFHQSLPGYAETPLVELQALSSRLGIGSLFVKDESGRFGLNSFKGLGGSRLAASVLGKRLGMEGLPGFEQLRRALDAHPGKRVTLCSATDGNHGRGIAWSAKALGLPCVIYLPKGSTAERVGHIARLGARTVVTDEKYDETVALARKTARQEGWVFVQDTDDEKSSETVRLLMLGYLTMAEEIRRRLPEPPSHVFLQAGVGSFAAAMAAYFSNVWVSRPPVFIVVEAQNAGCIARTAATDDGRIHAAEGSLQTMMAGLSCGVPCRLAWKILSKTASHYLIVRDEEAALAMRVLGNPLGADPRIISGESGAAGVAALLAACAEPGMKARLGLSDRSRVLCISTEGDTDAANYRRVAWNGIPALDKNI